MFGVAIFLGFLVFATQVLVHLYATSTVTAVAFDAARRVAAAGPDGGEHNPCATRVAEARSMLGAWGDDASIDCRFRDGEFATVRIVGPSPATGLRLYARVLDVDTIDRSASVRREGMVP